MKSKEVLLEAPPRLPDPMAPAPVRMLESVQLNNLGLTAAKNTERDLPRGQAARWFLLGWVEPIGWQPEPGELQEAAPGALAQLASERAGRGVTEEQWLAIPKVRARYERLFQLLDRGTGPEMGGAA